MKIPNVESLKKIRILDKYPLKKLEIGDSFRVVDYQDWKKLSPYAHTYGGNTLKRFKTKWDLNLWEGRIWRVEYYRIIRRKTNYCIIKDKSASETKIVIDK